MEQECERRKPATPPKIDPDKIAKKHVPGTPND